MTIKQFNATYLAPDDRILFRMNTVEDTEYRFWFTRRVTLFILSATRHLLLKGLEQTHSPQAAQAMAAFNQEAIKVNSNGESVFKGHVYQTGSHYPLGADPILIMDVKFTIEMQNSDNVLSLDLVLPGGANVNLKIAGSTLQALSLLLNQLREHAGWGDISQAQESSITPISNGGQLKTTLVH